MAALRKKYQNNPEFGGQRSAPPVTSTPTRLDFPPVSDAAPPPELPDNPVEQAAQQAIHEKLAAQEGVEQRAQPQQPAFATEPQDPRLEQAIANFPERTKQWLRNHQDFLSDPRKNPAMQHAHWQTIDDLGSDQMGDRYFEQMEIRLGLRQAPASRPVIPQNSAQRQAPGPQFSAPPTREAPSWASGRPLADSRVKLTSEEAEMADMLGLSRGEYAAQKARMLTLKPELRTQR